MAASHLFLVFVNLPWPKAWGSGVRTELCLLLGRSSTPRQCRMQWEHSSPLMRPLLQRGRLNSDGYKKRPKYLNRWGWHFYFLLYVLKAEIGSALCCMSSLFSHFPDWALNFVSNYSWWHPLSTGSFRQQADVTVPSNTLVDTALKHHDFVENVSSFY